MESKFVRVNQRLSMVDYLRSTRLQAKAAQNDTCTSSINYAVKVSHMFCQMIEALDKKSLLTTSSIKLPFPLPWLSHHQCFRPCRKLPLESHHNHR